MISVGPGYPGVRRPFGVVASTEEVLADPAADPGVLNPLEQARAARFRRDRDRNDFVAAHLLVRRCAARLLEIPPAEVEFVQHCADCSIPGHGRPGVAGRPEVSLSLSHTTGVVAAAAGFTPVAVDVEQLGSRQADPAVLARVLAPAEEKLVSAHPDPETAFLRQWVRKEAMIKLGLLELDSLATADLSALPLDQEPGSLAHYRTDDLHFTEFHDPRRGVLVAAAGPIPVLLGVSATPFTDLP
ncbi:4'-phosphopantetheinyl transferase family protein [Kitasatospora camelliae]|uniref:4'-phosphopantetheinyl transferase superfamily protein n=1 Tax=Kitasatospora camelliae TaxID=3156397 RepID=A0AAU8JSZ8_9ACTN